ncbi:MAG TPA: hypothetical protein DD734_04590, partial [Firmicutes bacterium]|nr:hypothetical protein [Bacillota bacterium]
SEKLSTIQSFFELFTVRCFENAFFSLFTEKKRFVKAGVIWYYYHHVFALSTIIFFLLGIMLITCFFRKQIIR